MKRHLLAVAICLLVASAAWAVPVVIPTPAWRGQEGTTLEEWQFSTDANPAQPELVNNPYGLPTATITTGFMSEGWFESDLALGNKHGMWDLGGEGGLISLNIPNRPTPLEYKEIWVAVTYFQDISAPPTINVVNGQRYGLQYSPILLEELPSGGAWYADVSIWRIYPNPNQETIEITSDPMFGSVIETITVDTQCVPEPATLTLLALGGLGLIIRRKRAK